MRKKKKPAVCKTTLFFKFDHNGSVLVSGFAWKTSIHPEPKQEQEQLRSVYYYYYYYCYYYTIWHSKISRGTQTVYIT